MALLKEAEEGDKKIKKKLYKRAERITQGHMKNLIKVHLP